uniref:DNA helicase n=1 Tax=Caenorhabditis tropicalis TaxID=1561998 RepID=A0A1I7U5G7_9PELO
MYESLMDAVRAAFDRAVPVVELSENNRSIPPYLQSFQAMLDREFEKALDSRLPEDFLSFVKLELLRLKAAGNSGFSKQAKRILKPRKIIVPAIKNTNGTISSTDDEKADALATSFQNQYTTPRVTPFKLPQQYESQQAIIWVTDDEIYKRIRASKNSCSATSDRVPFTFVKHIAPFISSGLAQIYT